MTATEQADPERDAHHEELFSPHPRAMVRSLMSDPDYVKCPRCWHYHTIKANYDCLCDRCCKTLVEDFKGHPSVPHIQENLEAQRKLYTATADNQTQGV